MAELLNSLITLGLLVLLQAVLGFDLFIIDEISDPLKFRTPIPIARPSFFNFCFAAFIGEIMSLFLSKIIEVFWGQ